MRRGFWAALAGRDEDEAPAWLRPHGEPWKVTGQTALHDNPWFSLTHYKAIAPTGRPANYYLQGYKNLAVGVLALHEARFKSLSCRFAKTADTALWLDHRGRAESEDDAFEENARDRHLEREPRYAGPVDLPG